MGRDKFCEIFLSLGYRVRHIKNYQRTTRPVWFDYPNLIEGMMVTRPYQVLQSDITYFRVKDRYYYIVFIMDVYTREILGYNVSDNLRTKSNIKALKMALRKIPAKYHDTMIHHSDRGSQYGSESYKSLLKSKGIRISMGETALDNAFVERLNGIIKNEYLKYRYITDFKSLKQNTKRAVNNYNSSRKHLAFNNEYTPLEFKKSLSKIAEYLRPTLIIFAKANSKIKQRTNYFINTMKEVYNTNSCPIDIKVYQATY